MNNSRLIFTISFLLIFAISTVHSLKVELIHRSAVSGVRDTEATLRLLHRRDLLRRGAAELRRRRAAEDGSSVAMPMNSGADYGVGEYFVHVRVGTPGQKFMLVADTGSDLTWMNCRYRCGSKCGTYKGRLKKKRVFLADRSTSFRAIPCQSDMCKVDLANLFSLTKCPTPSTPCAYDYRYLEGSSALGFFANEAISVGLTNGRKRTLTDVLIGCTESVTGDDQSGFNAADGVLGLGFTNHTLTSKLSQQFGGKFSYCLVDHLSPKNLSNYIVFGRETLETSLSSAMQHTSLVPGAAFYAVSVEGLSLGGLRLEIDPKVWDPSLGGGTVLDSGTSLTFLAGPAYGPVTRALEQSARAAGLQRLPDDGGPFEFCFSSTEGFDEAAVPRLRLHFAGGAVFEPPVKSYVIDVAPGKKCLGFISGVWPGTSTIGNILQQNHLWEFDLEQSRLGFAPSSCT